MQKTLNGDTQESRETSVSLLAVGDISLGARIDHKMTALDIFRQVRDRISHADVSVGNLECVLGDQGDQTQTYRNLRARSAWTKQLKLFTLLNLANNHIMDFGKKGMNETIRLLRNEGILTIGAGDNYLEALRPVILNVEFLRIGFLGFTYDEGSLFGDLSRARSFNRAGPARYNEQDVLNLVRRLKAKSHFVVASVHWGRENVNAPSPEQRSLAKKLIENGVDIVFGHHPHEVQGVERVARGLVFYSLGNFVFDPALSKTDYGLMVEISLSRMGGMSYTVHTVRTNNDLMPDEKHEENLLSDFRRKCEIFQASSGKVYANWWYEQTSKTFLESYKSNVALIRRFGLRYVPTFFIGLALPTSIRYYAGFIRLRLRKLIKKHQKGQ